MILDLDIYRTANLLVKRHGQDAPLHAAMRADELLEAGDLDGGTVWNPVLQSEDIGDGTVVSVSPKMPARRCVYKLGVDAHLVAGTTNAAFQHVAHPQVLGQGYALSAGNDHWQSFLSENQPDKRADRDLPRRFKENSCWYALCAAIIISGPWYQVRDVAHEKRGKP